MVFLRRKTIKGREYLYEVENYLADGHVRQRVLKYRGPVAPVRPRKKEEDKPRPETEPKKA